MKKLLALLAVLIILALALQNRLVFGQTIENIIYHSPCDTPIIYRVGTIDSRFNITREDFLTNIREAEDIWNSSYPKNLFSYDPKGELSISLVYDKRQLLNIQIGELNRDLTDKKNTITPETEEYKKRSIDFYKKLSALNEEIDYWNSQGGADPETYKKLKDDQEGLRKEAEELNKIAASLNQSTGQFNSKIQELNKTVSQFNEELKYKPEEGIYISDENGERIIVYFNISKDELVHTLAHEMGHALGIAHIEDAASIMYPQTTEVKTLSNNDLVALNEVCRKVSIFETMNNKFNYALGIIKQQGFQGLIENLRLGN